MIILGIGNIVQKDDGFGVYASKYLQKNYLFDDTIKIIDGGVLGINLFNIFEKNRDILILDTIDIKDAPSSIYLIPSTELSGYGLNSGGAHEIGVLQILDMLELQGKPIPKSTILAIIPKEVTFEISLSDELKKVFNHYIDTALKLLDKEGITYKQKESLVSLEEIIDSFKNPS